MGHLDEGMLRRLYDEPLAISEQARRHFTTCHDCRGRYAAVVADARAAAEELTVADVRIDPTHALARIRQRIAVEEAAGSAPAPRRWRERISIVNGMHRRRVIKPLGGVLAAAALVAALALTPVGSLAASFITIFEPQQIAAVPVTPSDLQSLRGLPDLSSFGTMSQTSAPQFQQVSSAAEARRQSGLTLLAPASLPASVPANPTYNVATQGTASFTFSAAKASAAANGKTLPAMPADLDGSTLQATVGPALIAVYGNNSSYNSGGSEIHNFPSLIVGEAAVPKVTSTHATVKQIEDYLLAMPGVPADLAAAIRAIGDPSSTLPIPIPVERANAQQIQVQGVDGLAIGDNTGIFSVIIWQKNGIVYGVGGTLPQDQALAIANSLH